MEKKKLSYYLTGYNKNIYNIFSYFFVCAFVGWIFETTVVLIRSGEMTERGLFFINHNPGYYFPFINSIPVLGNLPIIWGLPIIPIYGIGGCLIVLTFGKIKKHSIFIFLIGMITMTLFELLSSYFCEIVLHRVFWDYSADILNFQGRVCLRSALAWGILSLLAVKFLKPQLEHLYTQEKRVKHYKVLIRILMVYTAFCTVISMFDKGV